MIGEVGLAQHEQARDVRHQVIVHPQAAHGVVHGRENPHRHLVGALRGDLVVDVEEVAVTLPHAVFAQAGDRVGKIQINSEPARAHTAALVTDALRGPRRDVARAEVAERRIHPLEVIIALILRNRSRLLEPVSGFFRHPNPAVVAQRLRHQGEFRLVLAAHRNAGRVNLGVARVRQARTALVRPPDPGGVGAARVGGKVEHIAVATGRQDHGIGGMALDFPGDEIADDDPLGLPVHHHQIEHLFLRMEFDESRPDRPHQCGVGAEQQLLTRLTPRVKGAGNLRAAEGAVGEQAAVFAGERHALRHALVDDVHRYFGEPVHICLAGTIVPALERVVEQPVYAVAVVLVIFRGIDAALCCDRMGAARTVVENEILNLVAQISE